MSDLADIFFIIVSVIAVLLLVVLGFLIYRSDKKVEASKKVEVVKQEVKEDVKEEEVKEEVVEESTSDVVSEKVEVSLEEKIEEKPKKERQTNYHVSLNENDKWQVKREGSTRA